MYERIKESAKNLFVFMCISIFAYIPLIANNLTNTLDGLWQPTFYRAGGWELSIGRWGWVIFDIFKGGYATQPFSAIFTLLFIAAGLLLVLSMFEWKKHYYVFAFLFIISTTVCCYLSYVYMSPTFGFSIFTSFFSAWLLSREYDEKKDNIIKYIITTVFIVGTLSLYQANIGCFAIIVVVFSMHKLLDDEKQYAIAFLVKAIILAMMACVIYKALWDAALRVTGVSSAGFKGANSLSIIELAKSIPNGIALAYKAFFQFYVTGMGYYIFSIGRVVLLALVVFLLICMGIRRLKKDKFSLILYLVLLFLAPLAANVFCLLITQNVNLMIQMTGPLSLMLPLLLCLLDAEADGILRRIVLSIGLLLLYGNIIAVGTDLEAMQQGMNSSKAIVDNVCTTLIQDGFYSNEYKYAFVGRLSDNPLFKSNTLWDNANSYAKVGEFYLPLDCMMYSYEGLIDDMGINLQMVDMLQYVEIMSEKDTIESMPVYPNEGSVIRKGNTVIVKISDTYIVQ